MEKDWKIKLKYGKMKTPYHHYTVIAQRMAGDLQSGFSCRPGKAYMGMKTWCNSTGESADMIKVIGEDIGFNVTGRIEVFETDPTQPPRETPFGYDLTFTPYDKD